MANRQHMNTAGDERGASLIEYVLIVAAIALVAFAAVRSVGNSVDESFTETGDVLAASDDGAASGSHGSTAPNDGWSPAPGDTGGGGSGGGSAGGGPQGSGSSDVSDDTEATAQGGEGSGSGGTEFSADDEGAGQDGDVLGESTESGGGGSTSGDEGGSAAGSKDDDVSTTGGSSGGGGAGTVGGTSGKVTQSATVGRTGEFSVTFNVVDDKVVIGSITATGWTYEITKDSDQQIHIWFTKAKTGEKVYAKGWLTGSDKLKTQLK